MAMKEFPPTEHQSPEKFAMGEPGALFANLREFFKWAMREGPWQGCDLDGASVQDKAQTLGLIIKVPFDPERHEDKSGVDPAPGDDWFVFAPGITP